MRAQAPTYTRFELLCVARAPAARRKQQKTRPADYAPVERVRLLLISVSPRLVQGLQRNTDRLKHRAFNRGHVLRFYSAREGADPSRCWTPPAGNFETFCRCFVWNKDYTSFRLQIDQRYPFLPPQGKKREGSR